MKHTCAWMAVWWTKTSGDPSAGVMKPKPLTESKNFTVPACFEKNLAAIRAELFPGLANERRATNDIENNLFLGYYAAWRVKEFQ